MAGVGMAYLHQGIQEAAQQFVQIARLKLYPEQLIKSLCFGLADLVIGVVQSQDDAEMQLFAYPLEVRILIGEAALRNIGVSRRSYSCKALHDGAGREIQLRQAPAVVFYLLDINLSGGWPLARMRAAAPGVMEASATRILGSNCRGSNLPRFSLAWKRRSSVAA